jgi:tetratricopeptide (TPR) repeat protein
LAEKAIQLAPDLAEAHRALGDVATSRWDMETAFSSIKKALELDPSNDSYMSAFGLLSAQRGDMGQASTLIRKAIATDPLNARGHHNLAMVQLAEGDLERSYESALKAVSIAPSPARVMNLATVYMLLKQYDKALAEIPNIRDEFWERYLKIMIMSHSGRKDEVKELFAKFREKEKETGPFQIAEIYAVQDMRDEAFKWIELSFRYKDPGLVDIKLSPFMNVYKDDPRYKQTIARLKLL